VPHRLRTAPARRIALGAAALLLALGLAACGGSDDDGEPAAASPPAASSATEEPQTSPSSSAPAAPSEQESEAVTVTAGDFELQADEDTFTAGEVTFTLVNDGGSTHDLVVERDGQDVAAASAVDPGQTSTVTVTLEPGRYVLYCSIANHRAMGMETTIEVS
jgi:plastocyanin